MDSGLPADLGAEPAAALVAAALAVVAVEDSVVPVAGVAAVPVEPRVVEAARVEAECLPDPNLRFSGRAPCPSSRP